MLEFSKRTFSEVASYRSSKPSHLAGEDKIVIDFVGNDGHFVHLGHGQDLFEVGRREDAAARVRGRVDDDGGRFLVDERLHVLEVNLPVVVGQQVVFAGLDF